MKLSDITSFRLRGHEICKIYKGTNVIFNVCTGNYTWVMKQEINNPTPAGGDWFGSSISLYENTLVAGAKRDDTGATNTGSVYVYTRTGSAWALQQTINNPTPDADEWFGSSISLYGNTLVVGAPNDTVEDTGSCYVYTRMGLTWTIQQTITNPSPEASDWFGDSVSLYQDTLVVSASYDDTGAYNAGSVYVYTRTGGIWTPQQTINNPTPDAHDWFGDSISLFQDTLAIGVMRDTPNDQHTGSCCVYIRTGGVWTLQQTINNPTPEGYDSFGDSVSLFQDTLAIGAWGDETGEEDAGSCYVYIRMGSTWTLQQTINNPTPGYADDFGISISLHQDTLVVGAYNDSTGADGAGSCYVYTRTGGVWTLQQTINNPTPAVNDNFGYPVSLYGNTLAVGGPNDVGAAGAGSVYVYNYEEI